MLVLRANFVPFKLNFNNESKQYVFLSVAWRGCLFYFNIQKPQIVALACSMS
jgi:hypothetical protein